MPDNEKIGTVRKCPSCGASVETFQTRCSSCGHELNNIQTSETVQAFFQRLEAFSEREYQVNLQKELNEKNYKLQSQRIKASSNKIPIVFWILFFWILIPIALIKNGRGGYAFLFILLFIGIVGALWKSLQETVSSYTQGTVITKQIATVISDGLNIREQPSVDSKLVITLKNGNQLAVLDNSNNSNWYKVDYEGNVGYVHKDYITIQTITEHLPRDESIKKGISIPIPVILCIVGALIIIMLVIIITMKPKWTNDDKRRQSMIEGFPIPNSKEDLTEFIIQAAGRVKKIGFLPRTFSLNAKHQSMWNEIWISKCKQVYTKARIAMKDDPGSLNELRQILTEAGIVTVS